MANIRKPRGEVTNLSMEMYFRVMGLRKYYANALTMGNLLSGVLVMIGVFIWPFGAMVNGHLSAESFYEFGALSQEHRGMGMLILAGIWTVGLLCDVFDGWLARRLQTDGPMGVQLDSMADLVTSGVTPAVLGVMALHAWAPGIPTVLKFLPLTMALAAAWRLARFNVETGQKAIGFSGMPAPAAALWWIAILLVGAEYERFGSWGLYGVGGVLTVNVGVLIGSTLIPWWMISRRPMMDLKHWGDDVAYDLRRKMLLGLLTVVGISVGIFGSAFGLGIQAALLLYAFGGAMIRPKPSQT